jgi:hypothetical protein
VSPLQGRGGSSPEKQSAGHCVPAHFIQDTLDVPDQDCSVLRDARWGLPKPHERTTEHRSDSVFSGSPPRKNSAAQPALQDPSSGEEEDAPGGFLKVLPSRSRTSLKAFPQGRNQAGCRVARRRNAELHPLSSSAPAGDANLKVEAAHSDERGGAARAIRCGFSNVDHHKVAIEGNWPGSCQNARYQGFEGARYASDTRRSRCGPLVQIGRQSRRPQRALDTPSYGYGLIAATYVVPA